MIEPHDPTPRPQRRKLFPGRQFKYDERMTQDGAFRELAKRQAT